MNIRKEKFPPGEWCEVGRWSPVNHCVIEWTQLPEPPFYAAQYRKVAEVYEQADVPKLAAAPDMYEALKSCVEALADLLEQIENGEKFDNVASDCLIAELQDEVEKATAILKKARGEE